MGTCLQIFLRFHVGSSFLTRGYAMRKGWYIYISSGEDPKMSEKQFLNRR
jgi:Uri superfamily endonuclease